MKLACIGAGNMAGAVIKSALAANLLQGDEIGIVNERNPEHGRLAAEKLGVTYMKAEDIRFADAVMIGVKPQDFAAAAEMYRSFFREGQLVLSMMAGISFKKLKKELGDMHFVRSMPNMGVGVLCGVTGYAIGENVTAAEERFMHALCASGGTAIRLKSEDEIAKVIGAAGSSPAYFCFLAEALAAAAAADGMEPDSAAAFAREAFIGTAELLKNDPSLTPTELRRRISSKKGTTEAAIDRMAETGFMESVAAGYLRAVEKSDAMTKMFDEQ